MKIQNGLPVNLITCFFKYIFDSKTTENKKHM